MNLEDLKKQFPHVYEWKDAPNTIYPPHSHKGKVSVVVVHGEVIFYFPDINEQKTISAGERFDVPVGILHTAKVGLEGASYIIGEEIEGDS